MAFNLDTYLEIDALYLHAARQAYMRACLGQNQIELAIEQWKALEEEESRILAKYDGDSEAAYDEYEPICFQFESAHGKIGEAHAPLIKDIAVIHMLSVAALEAHINSIASEKLSGKELEAFFNFTLVAKWLFLPKILSCYGFSPSCQPFQRFAQLIRYRNNLIHYKGKSEDWVYGEVPNFLVNLGLTMEAASDSLTAVHEMIVEFANQRDLDPPYWLRPDLNEMSYFQIKSK